jgi:hypothetical protein
MRAVRSPKIRSKKKLAAKLETPQAQDDRFQTNSSPIQNSAANPDSTAEVSLNQQKSRATASINRIQSNRRYQNVSVLLCDSVTMTA